MASFIRSDDARFDFSDVTPVEQNDGPAPVAQIKYSAAYRELMDYFRAMMATEEYSERSLALTEEILHHNAANYTVWHFRRLALSALKKNVQEELDFMDNFAADNPKNYQIWHHRREMAKLSSDGERELKFTGTIFELDSKNYHAWAHRQWALKHFDIWDNEMEFVEGLLLEDVRNNSAWNQRWYVIHNRGQGRGDKIDSEGLTQEINFVFETVETSGVKNNESAWNYLRGIAIEHEVMQSVVQSRLRKFLEEQKSNVFAMSLLADLSAMDGSAAALDEAKGHYSLLCALDPVREKFWMRKIQEVEAYSSS